LNKSDFSADEIEIMRAESDIAEHQLMLYQRKVSTKQKSKKAARTESLADNPSFRESALIQGRISAIGSLEN
jgi:hypothetical protein